MVYSTWTTSDIIFLKIVLLSISPVFCIFLTTHSCQDLPFTSFFICSSRFSIPLPKHPTTRVLFQLWSLHASSEFQILTVGIFAIFPSVSQRCLLLPGRPYQLSRLYILWHLQELDQVFSLCSKSHTSFLPGFSMTVPFLHAALYQTVLSSSIPVSFPHSTASTIKAFLCLLTLLQEVCTPININLFQPFSLIHSNCSKCSNYHPYNLYFSEIPKSF